MGKRKERRRRRQRARERERERERRMLSAWRLAVASAGGRVTGTTASLPSFTLRFVAATGTSQENTTFAATRTFQSLFHSKSKSNETKKKKRGESIRASSSLATSSSSSSTCACACGKGATRPLSSSVPEEDPDNMLSTIVNGEEVWVPKGSNVMAACDAAGIDIPRFCYHPKLSIAGNCRMCLVDIENER